MQKGFANVCVLGRAINFFAPPGGGGDRPLPPVDPPLTKATANEKWNSLIHGFDDCLRICDLSNSVFRFS